MRKLPYLSIEFTNPKNKGSSFSSTFKVEELNFTITKKMRKWAYRSPGASNPKNKGTFFSSTLNFEEKKVPLFFGLESPGLRYGHFVILMKATT